MVSTLLIRDTYYFLPSIYFARMATPAILCNLTETCLEMRERYQLDHRNKLIQILFINHHHIFYFMFLQWPTTLKPILPGRNFEQTFLKLYTTNRKRSNVLGHQIDEPLRSLKIETSIHRIQFRTLWVAYLSICFAESTIFHNIAIRNYFQIQT